MTRTFLCVLGALILVFSLGACGGDDKPPSGDSGVADVFTAVPDLVVTQDKAVEASAVVDQDGDGYDVLQDCDDTDFNVNPGAAETCNGKDDNCDGETDEVTAEDAKTFYADQDGDKYGNPDDSQKGCVAPAGYVENKDDCNDADATINPDRVVYPDEDGDTFGDSTKSKKSCVLPLGYVTVGGDCDDQVETTYPGAVELCNSKDDNCNGQIDEVGAMGTILFYRDADEDGWGDAARSIEDCIAPTGYVAKKGDCDDGDKFVNPDATDVPDAYGTDDNCDKVDGVLAASIFVSETTGNDANDGKGKIALDGSLEIKPVRTLAKAITLAEACEPDCPVLIAEGTYVQSQSLALSPGVNLYGGYTTAWAHTRPNQAVKITATVSPTVKAQAITENTIVADLTIEGPIMTTPSGAESIALLVTSTGTAGRLTLRRAQVNGGTGAPGANGADKAYTGDPAAGGAGGVATDCASDQGDDGTGPGGGTGGSGGNSNCPHACPSLGGDSISDGGLGGDGSNGAGGMHGGTRAASVLGSFSGNDWIAAASGAGNNGARGAGGGGGGSGGTKRIESCPGCNGTLIGGSGGAGGAGGKAGEGGTGGQQGGASFGIVLVDSTITFDSAGVKSGTGGKGGNGGNGGNGERGAGGTNGAARPSKDCVGRNYQAGAGGKGGNGGDGGGGAGGAGGNGGPAIGIARVGTSSLQSAPTYASGTPGAGGAAGAGGRTGGNSTQAPSGQAGNPGASQNAQVY